MQLCLNSVFFLAFSSGMFYNEGMEHRNAEFSVKLGNVRFSIIIFENYGAAEEPAEQEHFVKLLHTHSYYELVLCVKGGCDFMTEEGPVPLAEGDYILVSPKQKHLFRDVEHETTMRLGIRYSRCGRNGIFPEVDEALSSLGWFRKRNAVRTQQALSALLSVFEQDCFAREYALQAAAMSLMCTLLDDLSPKRRTRTPDAIAVRMEINNAIIYRYMTALNAKELAGELFLSERQLNRVAHTMYGMSFNERKCRQRIGVAQKLLLETSLPNDKIAEQVGYISLSSFYAAFTRVTGTTPLRYRRQRR